MRASVILTALLLCGATMSDTVIAEEKKSTDKENYDLKCSVREKVGDGFLPARETIAFRATIDKKDCLYVWVAGTVIVPRQGSEITIDKTAYVVDKAVGLTTHYRCEVTEKKKP